MVSVSDKFKKLAQDNGRRVWCRIVADGEEFLDDRLIDMSFDDVVHPDWFTIGTTCANRLHFSARFTGELSAGAEVSAFISFDGEEWCPLGVFFISQRYVRGNIVSVTAYDRMYSLDIAFSYSGTLPATSDVILKKLCEDNGIICAEAGYPYKVESIPADCTVRDMIGYIAGINQACAKMDRQGRLTLKKHNTADYFLLDKSCWEVQRNMGRSTVTCVRVNTGDGELVAGNGAEISTLELYDPLMTQAILDNIYSMFKPFFFYGAELEMQGLPFLEAGDMIQFLDGKLLYPLVISEVEYTYDGGLSAKLYSKNKINEDGDDLEKLLQKLLHLKNAVYYKRVNQEQIALTTSEQIIADFDFETTEDCFAQLDVNFTLKNNDADILSVAVNANGSDVPRTFTQTLGQGDYHLLHVYHLAEALPAGKNRIYVTAKTRSGNSYIASGNMEATLVGHGIYGNSGSQQDKLPLYERVQRWKIGSPSMTMKAVTDDYSGGIT